ncbi:hypothetical protein F0562_006931 [Nyssa sinensis]|uniref:Uncharacterized protein n=1 Tax=Nyssa sinensis TaxID=561372 RepID=A0A5J5A2A5_9ASTE|nr:hypothetical protein F0562_006931 [Nyssa sinensis]
MMKTVCDDGNWERHDNEDGDVVELCKGLFKKWVKLDNSNFSAETISGGITNLLLKVSVKEENGNIVNMTVKLYGPNTEYVINHGRELQTS